MPHWACAQALCADRFQPFLRFWRFRDSIVKSMVGGVVSTLLEILARFDDIRVKLARLLDVSTLLEILGLACLVVVGF